MITHKITDDGYEFYLDGKLIAVGSYSETGFELCDSNDNISSHRNGMIAFRFLREKFLGLKFEPVTSFVSHIQSKPVEKIFVKHPALVGVNPIANWKKHGRS